MAPMSGFCENGSVYRPNEETFLTKYRHWRGASGRSYVFSVYSAGDCPAYDDAVLIVATRQGGSPRALACVDLGPFPEHRLAKLRQRFAAWPDEVEFHVHVLAERAGDRRSLIADITRGRAA
jgi:hypothetical protein